MGCGGPVCIVVRRGNVEQFELVALRWILRYRTHLFDNYGQTSRTMTQLHKATALT